MNNSKTILSDERIQTDKSLDAPRKEADAKDQNRQTNTSHKVEDEKRIGQERIARERKRSDSAVEFERSQVDAALEKERDEKGVLATKLLAHERELTDKNLSFERTQSDLEVIAGAKLLTDEQSEHSKTKVSLTTRNEFLAIVSHDLRNPIGAAASCADMLLGDSTFSGIDPEVRNWIEFIKRNVDVSLRMIADLLDVERMALGKLQLKIEKQSIGQVIRQSVESLAHLASAKNVLLRAVPIQGSDEAAFDCDRILQVISNLIGNALKFTPSGGKITVYGKLNKTEVEVRIEDTGVGIPDDKLGKIFDRFAQLSSSDRNGLGLGLYISKMLIEDHGGRIWARSKVNQGTQLFFTIPIQAVQSDEHVH